MGKDTYKLIFSMLLILSVQTQAYAGKHSADEKNLPYWPAGIISVDSRYAVLVEKSSQKLFFYRVTRDEVELIKKYSCSTGKVHGDKSVRGDRKTPEGVYFIRKLYADEQLPSRYGVMAFVLDFPNYLDKSNGKGGNGIWIHGLDRPLLPYDSKGCIALTNDDIMELKSYIKLYDTPVIIEEKITFETPLQIKRQREEVMRLLNRWENSWEEKSLEQYVNCYSHTRFKPDKTKWSQWKQHKKSLNNKYKFIDVDIKNLSILKSGKTYVVSFLQDYESDRFSSSGFKKLFLQANSENLKIVGEDWIKATAYTPGHDGSSVSEERKLIRFLNRWITLWENKKTDLYMGCYSKAFNSEGRGWKQWKQYKSKVNSNNRIIKVSVIKPRILIHGDDATVTFIQKYVSDTYTDYGLKRIGLLKEKGSWKIISEGWEPI